LALLGTKNFLTKITNMKKPMYQTMSHIYSCVLDMDAELKVRQDIHNPEIYILRLSKHWNVSEDYMLTPGYYPMYLGKDYE
jgi:hypothetical protein